MKWQTQHVIYSHPSALVEGEPTQDWLYPGSHASASITPLFFEWTDAVIDKAIWHFTVNFRSTAGRTCIFLHDSLQGLSAGYIDHVWSDDLPGDHEQPRFFERGVAAKLEIWRQARRSVLPQSD